jgi:alanyl-tRNA synthetase
MMSRGINQIRSTFIDYFVKNGHTNVHSSPLIPHNDPSLMFVNSGMVQFKNVFTGLESRAYSMATSSQKCVRAGGKHNDLENVGYTARHHTFFEMLGNFSFGDYFKEKAIYHSWELLTKEFGIDKNRLYVTVYYNDEEAISYWKKISGFGDDRIIRINTSDNFWSMGDTGPCGPCSEIFYDHGDNIFGGLPGTKDQDGDRYIEIWNMVFMQFEQKSKDIMIDLPKKSIDTGMGLERVSSVLQGVHDNFDTDLFKELINASEDLVGSKSSKESRFSHRVIADHLRSMSFLIVDGVMPSNEGRGYVLRRIMRRAMRHAHQLGAKDPLMYRLFPKLVDLMSPAYPELKRAEGFVSDILKQEEERFKVTIDKGLRLLEEEVVNIQSGGLLPGEVAFKLYDTYGFPLDLTEDILKERNIRVDHSGFAEKMEEQKSLARKSWSGSGEAKSEDLWFDIKNKFGPTEFLGYSSDEAYANVIAVVAREDGMIGVVTNQTPFYGESGGQMGDTGEIASEKFLAHVMDTKKYLGIHVHICKVEYGSLKDGDTVSLKINKQYRDNLRIHHSATHILHSVLRDVLGPHVIQKGSLVSFDKLRFDISHPKALSPNEIELIEDRVNKIIRDNTPVNTKLMSTEDAINQGAMALFGEKYDSEVRVVSMGDSYSIELCGGTHVRFTGDIGTFKIISESAIAAGIRRIEAVCGEFAEKYFRANDTLISEICALFKTNKSDVKAKVEKLLQSYKDAEKEIEFLKVSNLKIDNPQINIDGVKFLYKVSSNLDVKSMRIVAEEASKKDDNVVVVMISTLIDKLNIVVSVSKALSGRVSAADIAKYLSSEFGGTGGGGSDTLAQSGGVDVAKTDRIPELMTRYLSESPN